MKKLITLIILLCLSCCSPEETEYLSTNNTQWENYELNVLSHINVLRDDNHKLIQDDSLYKYAKERALEIATGEFNHSRFNRVFTILKGMGLNSVAENLGYGYDEPFDVVFAWSRSEAHNDVMSNPNYKYVGIGMFEYEGENYICLLLGY